MLQLLFLFLIPGLFFSTEGYFRRFSCEHGHLTINCGSKEIDIVSASYGRTTRHVCRHGPIRTTWCHSGTSMRVVRHRCQGQHRCTLYASNSAFGDPCVGTTKYLEVSYKCVSKAGCRGKLLQICEGSSYAFHCHGNKRIKIVSANYGRMTGGHICGGPIRTTNCGAAGALRKVRRSCQGRSRCLLRATNGRFGDPCIGTKKYLEVRYFCQ